MEIFDYDNILLLPRKCRVDSRSECDPSVEFGGRRFHCWKRAGHGTVSFERSIVESCDVYYYDIAQKVGIDQIAEMGRRLGLGQAFDIPMSAITEGIMPDKAWKLERHKADWRIGDTINASIGQGYVLTSPLQLAVMTARLATGRAVVPRLVHMVNDQEMPVAEPPPLGAVAGRRSPVAEHPAKVYLALGQKSK